MTTELLLAKLTKLTSESIENLSTFTPVLNKSSLESLLEEIIEQAEPAKKESELIQNDDDVEVSFLFNNMSNLEFTDSDYKYMNTEWQEVKIDALRTYLGKDDNEDEGVDLAQLYMDETGQIWIRAKISVSQELAHKAEGDKPKVILLEIFKEYKEIFSKKASEWFPKYCQWDHAIDLKLDFVLKDSKIYPMSSHKQEKLEEFLKENLWKGYIRPSKSPNASPFFFVSKKESMKLWPCQNYCHLNEGTIKNTYPLPWVNDLLDKLKGAKHFTKLDFRWGYNNIQIKEGDKWKATFKMNKELFKLTVMFFGLCNSSVTFQNMINDIFAEEINEEWVLVYIDNILIFLDNKPTLWKNTFHILKKLKENDLYCNLDKCTFEVNEVNYLGMIILENQIKMDLMKLAGIWDWPTPRDWQG